MGERENLTAPIYTSVLRLAKLSNFIFFVNMLITSLHRFLLIYIYAVTLFTYSYTIRDMAPKYIKYAIRYNKTGY